MIEILELKKNEIFNVKNRTKSELIKALCIRFIDDYIVKYAYVYDKFKSYKIEKNKINNDYIKQNITSKLKPTPLKNNDQNLSSWIKVPKPTNIFKHNILDRIVKLITPTQYTIRSLFLTVFSTLEPPVAYEYIKKSIDSNFLFYSKDAFVIFIKLVEKICKLEYYKCFDGTNLMKFTYNSVIKILFSVLEKFISNKEDKEIKKYFNDIFESNKICLKYFFNILNSSYFNVDIIESDETEKENIENKKEDISIFKENIKQSLKLIISKCLKIHQNAFFYNLIIGLYKKTDEIYFIADLLDILLSEIINNNSINEEKNSIYKYSNEKNFIVLLYRMIFTSPDFAKNNEIFTMKNFDEKLIKFFQMMTCNQLVYSKLRFATVSSKYNSADDGKQRTILEMLFEILLELFYIHQVEKYLSLLEDYIIDNNQSTSIFYYIDLFYFYPRLIPQAIFDKFDKKIIEFLEAKVFKQACNSLILSTYFFLVKLFVYINQFSLNDQYNKQTDLLIKISKILIKDIYNLTTYVNVKSLNSHMGKVEVKDIFYSEIKKLFESILLQKKQADFEFIKNSFDEILSFNPNQFKKYFRVSAKKIDSALDSILDIEKPIRKDTLLKSNSVDSFLKTKTVVSKSSDNLQLGQSKNGPIKYADNHKLENTFKKKNDLNIKYSSTFELISPSTCSQLSCNYNINSPYTKLNTLNSSVISYEKTLINRSETHLKSVKSIRLADQFKNNAQEIQTFVDNLKKGELMFPLTFKDIIHYKPTKEIMLSKCGVYFKENFFWNELFIQEVKNKYNTALSKKNEKFPIFLNYPQKVRNKYTSNYTRPFLKPDKSFFSISNSKPFLNNSFDKKGKHIKPFSFSDSFLTLSHNYITKSTIEEKNNLNSIIKLKPFYQNKHSDLEIELLSKNESFYCELITNTGVIFGKLFLCSNYILFKSEFIEEIYDTKTSNKDNLYYNKLDFVFSSIYNDIIFVEKEIVIYFKDIEEIINRRFLFMWQANEIFLKDGKSYFFNLFKTVNNDKFLKILNDISTLFSKEVNFRIITNVKKNLRDNEYIKKWQNGEISNFDYIMLINKLSGRTFQDMNQYPVLPWIVSNFKDDILDINDKNNFRNLQYPISVQTDSKRQEKMIKYDDYNIGKFKNHHTTHYSDSAFVMYYLIRITPFNHNLIKFQGGKFECANRSFHSIKEIWEILSEGNDNRELTPEFFYQPEIFYNLNSNNFGERGSDKKRVHNLITPDWASSGFEFIYMHKYLFECRMISQNLNLWIDNIFGHNQLNKNKESLNVFNKSSYEQETKLDKKLEIYKNKYLDTSDIIKKIRDKVHRIIGSGQTPFKLFDEKHTKKMNGNSKSISNKELYPEPDIINSKLKIDISDFKNGIRYFNFSKTYFYILNGEKEIEIYDKIKHIKRNKIRLKSFLKMNSFPCEDGLKKKLPIYRLKYAIIELKDTKFLVSCRHLDNSFKIYFGENNIKEILCNSFVCSIVKYNNDENLFTGHNNGKLRCWKLEYPKNDICIKPINEILAHEDAVTCIYLHENLKIVITGGEDGYIYMRNIYDLIILSCFMPQYESIDRGFKIIDIIISEYDFIYITCFQNNKHYLFGYTLNGINFSSTTGLINNVEFAQKGKLLIGYYDTNKISLVEPFDLNKIIHERRIELIENFDIFIHFSNLKDNNCIVYANYNGNLKSMLPI